MATSPVPARAPVPLPPPSASEAELLAFAAREAVPALRGGGVIAVPTDTIYGVCCASQSAAAVRRLYALKGRDADKPVAVCVPSLAAVREVAELTVGDDVLGALLPGPVTLVFTRTPRLNPELNPGTRLVGVRIPDHPFVRALCAAAGEPLALTSANASGERSTLSVDEFAYLWPRLDVVLDGGAIAPSPAQRSGSTIVDLSVPGVYRVVRTGSAEAATRATLARFGIVEAAAPGAG